MKTTSKILIVLVLVGVVASAALLLIAATGEGQESLKVLVMNKVVSKVDGHPTVDAIVEKVPDDCLKCHGEGSHGGAFNEAGW